MAAKHHRTLVITIKSPGGLSEKEARALADQVRGIVAPEAAYQVSTLDVIGSQRVYVGPYGKKAEILEQLEQLPESLTEAEIADRLSLSTRQVRRYRSLLRQLADV